jgi:hypothetical protein
MISLLGAEKLSLVEIEAFLAASESVRFAGCKPKPAELSGNDPRQNAPFA